MRGVRPEAAVDAIRVESIYIHEWFRPYRRRLAQSDDEFVFLLLVAAVSSRSQWCSRINMRRKKAGSESSTADHLGGILLWSRHDDRKITNIGHLDVALILKDFDADASLVVSRNEHPIVTMSEKTRAKAKFRASRFCIITDTPSPCSRWLGISWSR